MARRVEQRREEVRPRRGLGLQLAVIEELGQRALRLGALHAVDRAGVVTGDHQQPLYAGKPGLGVIVVGLFREIDRGALGRIRRPRRGESAPAG